MEPKAPFLSLKANAFGRGNGQLGERLAGTSGVLWLAEARKCTGAPWNTKHRIWHTIEYANTLWDTLFCASEAHSQSTDGGHPMA
ncbi:hypothetical protein TIFTF001_034438 [Ficus carica]|uniref:Uncharacterized protein n=1 Tax=Ficus carica TaxID=3494 RepID=A0AA88JAK7_FICCA|nr:hypothetical protein TIFTF001_034438 [Ficus carica]